ncbi:MAG TPA: TlpA disulfide reductase family protein [Gemmataceae bacterium]|nr:TlpA disulfide reductase family protein [Gemmataceae bacterium]
MQRVLFAGLVLALGLPGAAFGDDPASPLARKLAQLKKKHEADEKELKKKLADAKAADDKQQVNFLIKELHAFTASDAVELAQEGKKDEAGLEAAVFAIKLLGPFKLTGADMDKAIAIIMDHHIDNPKIAPALAEMVDAGPNGLAFLESVVDKALNKEVQALALYYNALAEDAKATAAEGPTGDPVKIAAVRARAADMMERAVKLAPDARVGEDTLAKTVPAELVALKLAVGSAVPEVEGTDLDGKKVKLSSFRGKVVLLDFWATWCGPCVAMIPHERELVSKMSEKPFALIGVSVDEEKDALTEFLGRQKMPWAQWWDGPKGQLTRMFKVRSFPTLYLIDAKGVVRHKWVSSPGDEVIDKAVAELVVEAEKGKR